MQSSAWGAEWAYLFVCLFILFFSLFFFFPSQENALHPLWLTRPCVAVGLRGVPGVLLLHLPGPMGEQGKLLARFLPQFPCLSFPIRCGVEISPSGSGTGVTSGCALRSVNSSCRGLLLILINSQARSGLRWQGGTGGGRCEAALSHRAGAGGGQPCTEPRHTHCTPEWDSWGLGDAGHEPSSSSSRSCCMWERASGAGEQRSGHGAALSTGMLATPRARRAPWPQLPLSAVIESQAGLAGLLCDLVN